MRWACTLLVGVALAACDAPPAVDATSVDATSGAGDPDVASGGSPAAPPVDPEVLARLRLDTTPRPAPTNRWADDPAAAALGHALFYDPGLSPSGTVSCATCHDPARNFGGSTPLAEALGTTDRHAPTIPGSQWGAWFYWDGRADSLWAQALGPMEAAAEMGGDRMYVARYVTTAYADDWTASFGQPPDFSDMGRFPAHARPGEGPMGEAWEAMAPEDRALVDQVFATAAKAIGAFERTLVPTDAPFDRYVDAVLAGDPDGGGHLTDEAVRGLELFVGRANCIACHHGPQFTDRAFHNLGLPEPHGYDPGRAAGAVKVLKSEASCGGPMADTDDCPELTYLDPAFPDFQAAFKTPSLRNVATSAPYMHKGQFATLADVLTFYSELPGDPAVNHRELTLQPLGLGAGDKAALEAFLRSLTGPLPEAQLAPPPPSDGS